MSQNFKNDSSVTTNGYLRNSFVFLSLSLLSAVINYAYYPVIAHFLPPSEFGAIQALLAVLLQISAVFSGLNLVTIYLVHKYEPHQATQSIEILQKATTYFFVVATAIVILAQNYLINFLHLDNRAFVLITGINLITSIPYIIAFGHLQAKRHFMEAGLLQLVVVIIKLLLGAIAANKFGASGALLGIAVGQVLGMLIFWLISRFSQIKLWSHSVTSSLRPPAWSELKLLSPMSKNIASIFLVNVLVAIFISFDIVAARHFFNPDTSGLYAGASTISNAIVFSCLPLIGVLLPHLDRQYLHKSRRLLLKTGSVITFISITAVICLSVFPDFWLGIFGHTYQQLSYLLWRLGILMSLVAGITFLSQVSAFYRPAKTAAINIFGLAALIVAATTHHDNLKSFVSAIGVVFSIILFIGLMEIILIYNGYSQKR